MRSGDFNFIYTKDFQNLILRNFIHFLLVLIGTLLTTIGINEEDITTLEIFVIFLLLWFIFFINDVIKYIKSEKSANGKKKEKTDRERIDLIIPTNCVDCYSTKNLISKTTEFTYQDQDKNQILDYYCCQKCINYSRIRGIAVLLLSLISFIVIDDLLHNPVVLEDKGDIYFTILEYGKILVPLVFLLVSISFFWFVGYVEKIESQDKIVKAFKFKSEVYCKDFFKQNKETGKNIYFIEKNSQIALKKGNIEFFNLIDAIMPLKAKDSLSNRTMINFFIFNTIRIPKKILDLIDKVFNRIDFLMIPVIFSVFLLYIGLDFFKIKIDLDQLLYFTSFFNVILIALFLIYFLFDIFYIQLNLLKNPKNLCLSEINRIIVELKLKTLSESNLSVNNLLKKLKEYIDINEVQKIEDIKKQYNSKFQ